jgi:hypothetical protein
MLYLAMLSVSRQHRASGEFMNENGGKIFDRGDRNVRLKTNPSNTLFTINPAWPTLGSSLALHRENPEFYSLTLHFKIARHYSVFESVISGCKVYSRTFD